MLVDFYVVVVLDILIGCGEFWCEVCDCWVGEFREGVVGGNSDFFLEVELSYCFVWG